jgi:hypothetical protein
VAARREHETMTATSQPAAHAHAAEPTAPQPVAADAAAGLAPGRRAQWMTQRLNEVPQFVIFLYNALIDPSIEWRYKHHMFATLRYVFDPSDKVIADDDPVFARIDDVCMIYRCFAEIIGTCPQAKLARYVEVLYREGIDIYRDLSEVPLFLGNFYFAMSKLYPGRVDNLAELCGSAIKTGELVRKLQAYISSHHKQSWATERMLRVEVFLDNYPAP